MPNKECSKRCSDVLIVELKRMTREAIDYLRTKRLELAEAKEIKGKVA